MTKKSTVAGEFITEHILNVMSDYGTDALKEVVQDALTNTSLEVASTIGIDMLGSMIPAIGGAISTYRTERKIQNLRIAIKELNDKSNLIMENLSNQNEENKIKIDKVLELLFDKVITTTQEEKIEYMVNGFVQVTRAENVNFDISYLYYDTLDRLTLLDISCLQLSFSSGYFEDGDNKTYRDVLEEFNIEYSQYEAVRENLLRMGLLENQYEETSAKDFKNSVDAINDLHKVVKSIQDALSNPKKKMIKVKSNLNLKPKARDRLKISKFGRDFVKHFINL